MFNPLSLGSLVSIPEALEKGSLILTCKVRKREGRPPNKCTTDYYTAKEIRYLFLSSNKRLIMEFHLYFSNNVTPHL